MKKLIISKRQVDDVTFLLLNGDVTYGEGSRLLRTAIRRLLSVGKKKIYLDLKEVEYLDSSGIGELVSGFIAIEREQGQLKLLNLPSRSRELLTICKLLSIFEVDESAEETIGSHG
jgi:anti-sigma B factor antagonist